ncbi:transmembrane protein 35B isoform X1 [Amblyraja radiata]|uniref:transmembrane protein 35B isoform X1 n=1 Tax=Amblyraja radiata TaxID=386614 RepID=UPI001401FF25|nr:transmembrane protein 35B isoform X1 [Amblyraja radiata]
MALMFEALRLVVGLLFMFTGALKLTDQVSADLYVEGLEEFVKFAEVFPLRKLGVDVDPLVFMTVVGWCELIGGLLLAVGPRIVQKISNVVLSVIMIGAIYSLLMLKKPLYMCLPATICLAILLLLLQVWRKERKKQKEE